MEKLTFLIDSLNRAAERYHLTQEDPDMKVKFIEKTTATMVSPSDMEVVLNIRVEYNYHGLVVTKALVKAVARRSGFLRNKEFRDKRPVRSANDCHVHEDLVNRCCDELVSAIILGTGDWSFRKVITGDAVVNLFANSPEPYYGMTFKDIIRYEVGSIHKENTKKIKL